MDRGASEQVSPALGQAHLFNDEQNAVRRKEYFVLVTTTRTSELNTVDSWNEEICVIGFSQQNKAKALRMRNVDGRKLTEKNRRKRRRKRKRIE